MAQKNQQPDQSQQPACGGPKEAVGAAFVTLAANVGVGLISGLVAGLVAASRAGASPQEIADSARRGLIAGSAVHGAIMTGVGLYSAEKHPYFSGASTYVGVAVLGTAALVAVMPTADLRGSLGVGSPTGSAAPTSAQGAGLMPPYGGPAIDPTRLSGAPRMRQGPMDFVSPRRPT